MAKSSYLPKFLLALTLFFYSNFSSTDVAASVILQKTLSKKRALIKRIYTAEIGVREQGANAGVRIEQYQKYVGIQKGDSWCSAFVCWVYGKARVANKRTGWTPAMFPSDKVIWQKNNSKQTGIPKTGDVFGLWINQKGRIAHVGFVDKWEGRWVITVEGNTIIPGNKMGEGVYRKRRLISGISMVASYTD